MWQGNLAVLQVSPCAREQYRHILVYMSGNHLLIICLFVLCSNCTMFAKLFLLLTANTQIIFN